MPRHMYLNVWVMLQNLVLSFVLSFVPAALKKSLPISKMPAAPPRLLLFPGGRFY